MIKKVESLKKSSKKTTGSLSRFYKAKLFTSSGIILRKSFAEYPVHSITAIAAIISAGLLESFGLLTLLPVINIAMAQHGLVAPSDPVSKYQEHLAAILEKLHVDPSMPILLVIMFAMIFLKAVFLLVAKTHVGSVTSRVSADLRLRLLRVLLSASWPHFVSYPAGRFSNALSTEATRASTSFTAGWFMVAAAVQAAILLSISFALSREVFVAAMAVGIIMTLCLSWTIRMARAAGDQETKLMNSLVARLTDHLQGIKPLKAMGLERLLLPYLENEAGKLRVAQSHQSFAFAAQTALPEPLLLGFLALGIYFCLIYTSIELPVLFVLAVFFNRIMGKISETQKYYQMMVSTESAYHSLEKIIDDARLSQTSASPRGNEKLRSLDTGITFRDVSYDYESKEALKNLDLEIPARQLTALSGPSGSGKTTVVDLITGLLSPKSGVILFDGKPQSRLDIKSRVGYVPQEVFLFHDTLANNISLREAQVTDEQIWEALERAEAASFVRQMENGIHTNLGERGSRLSGGQRQRIMIARALVRKPEILILDEATTALDLASELQLCATIKALSKETTVIAISHQPAVISIADNVIDLKPTASSSNDAASTFLTKEQK